MSGLSRFFLRAKHWQLFLPLMLAFLLELPSVFVGSFPFVSLHAAALAAGIARVLTLIVLYSWMWATGSFLYSRLPQQFRFELPLFYCGIIFPAVYLSLAPTIAAADNSALAHWKLALKALAIFCSIYDIRCVAASLTSVRTGKSPDFIEYAGPFFQIWFFAIGLWFLQPKINRLYDGTVIE